MYEQDVRVNTQTHTHVFTPTQKHTHTQAHSQYIKTIGENVLPRLFAGLVYPQSVALNNVDLIDFSVRL